MGGSFFWVYPRVLNFEFEFIPVPFFESPEFFTRLELFVPLLFSRISSALSTLKWACLVRALFVRELLESFAPKNLKEIRDCDTYRQRF